MTNTRKRKSYYKTKKQRQNNYSFQRNNITNIEQLTDELIAFINNKNAESFPVKAYQQGKYSANLQAIKRRFGNLRKYKYRLINKPYKLRAKYDLPLVFMNYRDLRDNLIKPTILLFDKQNYFNYDLISDYFQELVRMKCRRYNSDESPYDFWFGLKDGIYSAEYHKKNILSVLKVCKNKFSGVVNAHTLNEAVYQLTNECSSFRPTVIASIIKLFGGRKRVLDISSGWGDRLIGSIASGVDYYFGVDPNPDVHPGYDAIRHIFGVSNNKFITKKSGFETVKIQMPPGIDKDGNPLKFDLIMTSPPYFDLEIYTQEQGQSVLGRGKEAWLSEFMLPSLNKAWSVLGEDGILALNINNKSDAALGEGYVEDIIRHMNAMDDADFRGCISYAEFYSGVGKGKNAGSGKQLRNPQPIWIWRKLPDIQTQQNKFSELIKKPFNPKLKIIPVEIPNPQITKKSIKEKNGEKIKKKIHINVIRDDLLEAGAKQRAMIPYFKENPAREFVYMSPFTGSAQVTLSYSALYTGKRATVFLDKRRPRHPLTRKAASYGLTDLVEIQGGGFKKMEPMVDEYVKWKQLEKGPDYVYKFSLGFANNRWIDILAKQLKEALPTSLLNNPPRRIWVPTGSTALINAFYRVFPKAEYPDLKFLVVQIGKTVWDDQVDLTRTTIYRTTEFFYDVAKRQPPFPSSRAYDAKAWAFVLDHGEDGDYLMNIISDPVN
jgi:hypothetical protein